MLHTCQVIIAQKNQRSYKREGVFFLFFFTIQTMERGNPSWIYNILFEIRLPRNRKFPLNVQDSQFSTSLSVICRETKVMLLLQFQFWIYMIMKFIKLSCIFSLLNSTYS
jgi:hypothetical protein